MLKVGDKVIIREDAIDILRNCGDNGFDYNGRALMVGRIGVIYKIRYDFCYIEPIDVTKPDFTFYDWPEMCLLKVNIIEKYIKKITNK